MSQMPTTTFSTRIDAELKTRLEQIAKYEERSTSYMANRAIQNMVEEREATRELLEVGLALIEKGALGIPSEQMHKWFMDDEDVPFPEVSKNS